jgi:hypothetical protein
MLKRCFCNVMAPQAGIVEIGTDVLAEHKIHHRVMYYGKFCSISE